VHYLVNKLTDNNDARWKPEIEKKGIVTLLINQWSKADCTLPSSVRL